MEPPGDLSDSEYLPVTDPEPSIPTAPTQEPAEPAERAGDGFKQSTLSFGRPSPSEYLAKLNPAQREAVTASAEGGLAIHAGPGSGKTAVLTTRVAYLVQKGGIKPEELVVVTFTNKAANEMKVRLSKIVGAETVDKLVMGTFHSVCVRYLRKYAKLVNLASNFLITDRDDCLGVIKRLLQALPVPAKLKREMKPQTWLESISKCKSRMMSPDQYRADRSAAVDQEKIEWVARMYEAYEDALASGNALDFDDLLVRGYQLFRNHPRVIAKIKSVLIDEFQDTNSVQYDIVKLIAAPSGSLTVVGDPDQSIYGWRNAEIENLEKMLKDFHPVRQIFLEENYRSTGAILGAALAVVRQDTKRINKSLTTSHPAGSSVVLHPAPSAQDEATFIASTIKHLVAHLGGLVGYNDFAVLLRYGALSRNIEVALQKAGTPSRMVGGHKFFERIEIKDMLCYLQLLSNPSYSPALMRIINVPRRAIGDKTIREIVAPAEKKKISPFEVCVKIANGQSIVQGMTAAQRKGIRTLVELVRDGRKKADEGADVASLIDMIVDRVGYRAHLEKQHSHDAAERWENVEELKAYATVVAQENPSTADLATAADPEEGDSQFEEVAILPKETTPAIEDDDSDIEIVESPKPKSRRRKGTEETEKLEVPLSSQAAVEGATTPLEVFLATSMLATDTETQAAKGDAKLEKVTISTCHAAKGLEWPVVFIPACEDGTYPFFRSTDANEVDEERRLLYVAITRAQSFCFLSYAAQRMAGAEMKQKTPSPFIATASQTYPSLFVKKLQKVTPKLRGEVAKVVGRAAPSEEVAKKMIDEYLATMPVDPPVWDGTSQPSGSRDYGSFGSSSGRYGGFGSQGRYGGTFGSSQGQSQGRWSTPAVSQPQAVPPGQGGFRSALSTFKGSAGGPGTGVNLTTAGSAPASSSLSNRSGVFTAPRPAGSTAPFKPPTLASSAAPRLPPTSLAGSVGALAPLPPKPPVDGAPGVVETRASRINDVVLVNPKLAPASLTTGGGRDLLASFQKGAGDELEALKRFAGGSEEGEIHVAQEPVGVQSGAPMSPKAKKKRSASSVGAATTAGGKKAKR
ncbi:ATP-dependent DNA helicase srs2 [Rhodotorula toruloides]